MSSDHTPSDYYLFRSVDHFLRGRNFENFEAVEVSLTDSTYQKTDWYHRGIINLAERWPKTTEYYSLYFEVEFNLLSENIPNKIL